MDWEKPKIPDSVSRPSITDCYKEHMWLFLKDIEPKLGKDFFDKFINQIIKSKAKSPTITYVDHPRSGTAELKTCKMGKYLSLVKDKVVLPFGSSYKPENVEEGFLKGPIKNAKINRKKSKGLMFKYERENNEVLRDFYNFDQATQKIGMNSIFGAMGSKKSFLSDKAGFNSITSTARWFLSHAFSYTERLLSGNFYFYSQEYIWNHLILLKKICPPKEVIDGLVEKYDLKIIWSEDIYNFLNEKYRLYNGFDLPRNFSTWLEAEPQYYWIFVYYFSNIKHLLVNGFKDGKGFVDHLCKEDNTLLEDDKYLDTLSGDDVILLTIIHNKKYPTITEDNGTKRQASLKEIRELFPEVAKELAGDAKHIFDTLDNIKPLFDVFIHSDIAVAENLKQPFMFRESVLGGDTDSELFTNKDWIKWYTEGYILNTKGLRINALIVYFLSQCMARYLYLISSHLGAVGEGRSVMNMKNEYTFLTMVLTNLKKHYMALIAIQEGVVLSKPKKEIKGVGFRGSKLSKLTLDQCEKEILRILNDIVQYSQIDYDTCVSNVIDVELSIKNSINNGEMMYYSSVPIRPKEDYAEGSSIHDNFEVWEEVFGNYYGHIPYYSKCTVVPLQKITSEQLESLIESSAGKSKKIYLKLKEVLIRWGKKQLTRIPVHPEITTVPSELIPFIDVPKVINTNLSPFYLTLRSYGITTGGTLKKPIFFSDIYTKKVEDKNK